MTKEPRTPNPSDDPAGSPAPGEPVFLAVGRLRRAHGVRGEMQMDVLTDFPERIKRGVTLYASEARMPLKVRGVRWHNRAMLITFQEYHTPEEAAGMRNQIVYVRAENLPPLEEDEYYHHQVLGLRAVAEDGAPLGTLVDILETGANDVYVIRRENGPDILLPAIEETILAVDLEAGEMRVHLLPGLLQE